MNDLLNAVCFGVGCFVGCWIWDKIKARKARTTNTPICVNQKGD